MAVRAFLTGKTRCAQDANSSAELRPANSLSSRSREAPDSGSVRTGLRCPVDSFQFRRPGDDPTGALPLPFVLRPEAPSVFAGATAARSGASVASSPAIQIGRAHG